MSVAEIIPVAARRTLPAAVPVSVPTLAPVESSTPAHGTARREELVVRGIAKSFPARGLVLTGVDFAVAHGQSVALIGANGTGKSTLLRCCLRLVEPDSGSVRLLDTEIGELKGTALRRLRARVGFVFQRHNLVPRLSALSNVLHGAQAKGVGPRYWLHGLAPRYTRQAALHCLDRVGLADRALQRTDSLSG